MPASRLDLRSITKAIGVYALCDLDDVPFYVGQTVSLPERGIQGRVRRHITSARSDVIANRQIDVWEIAYVWAWPVQPADQVSFLERQIYDYVRSQGTLVAGKSLAGPVTRLRELPPYERVCVRPAAEIEARRDVVQRLPRQLFHLQQLLDVMLDRKDTVDLRYSLEAHFRRLGNLYNAFANANVPEGSDDAEE